MKLKLIMTMLVIFGTTGAVYATPLKPEKCPNVSALQVTSFDEVEQIAGYWYASINSNNFDTNDKWSFLIQIKSADDENDATTKALEAVKTLRLEEGPINLDEVESGCFYASSQNDKAGAFTPPRFSSNIASLIR
jgi:hypothetical protein